jgi:ABC-type transport system involved in multi-copper enzyme maturation permease subunit
VTALLASSWLLFRTHLPRLLRARRTLLVLLGALLPAGIALLVAGFARRSSSGELAVAGGWMVLVQVVVPLCALVLGSAAVAEEVEDRTITYLFTRPMPRAALLLGRFAAIAVVLLCVLALGTELFLQAAGRASRAGPAIDAGVRGPLYAAVLCGGLVYGALAAALGAFVRHPIVVGLGYAFAVEGFLANLPGRNQALAVQHHLRSLIAAHGSPAWGKVEGFASQAFEPGATALTVLAAITVLALALGAWRLTRREFVLSA